LSSPILEKEIMQGLWTLKPFKALGPNKLHASFFQYFWADVKFSVCKEISNVFEVRVMPEYLNETLISLIPKCPSPEGLNNFKPISLCNSMYKAVTKIIVGCLRPYLDRLVSPNQTTFVLGRRGLDDVVVAQELIHTLDKKKGKARIMVIKVDLAF